MPAGLVRACITMLPKLQAEEQLAAISAASIGGGHVKPADSRRAIRDLERAANGGRRRAMKATPEVLAAMGIAVIKQQEGGDER